MKVIQLESHIEKWEQSSDNFTGNTLDGEKQSFLLSPNHPEYKTIFQIGANIYITDPDTDFILDIDIKSLIQLEIEGAIPTLNELYEAYLEARKQWNYKILQESLKRGVTIYRQAPPAPFSELVEYLNKVLNTTYNQN